MPGRKRSEHLLPTCPQCPFFSRAEGVEIHCKGGAIAGADDIHRFRSVEEYNTQYKNFCCYVYTRCPAYLTIKHWKWDAEEVDE